MLTHLGITAEDRPIAPETAAKMVERRAPPPCTDSRGTYRLGNCVPSQCAQPISAKCREKIRPEPVPTPMSEPALRARPLPGSGPLRTCLRCGYVWRQKLLEGRPRTCARCCNKYWDKPYVIAIEKRGGRRKAAKGC